MNKIFSYNDDKVAILYEDREISYKELNVQVDYISKMLTNRKLVLVLCDNTYESIIAYLATMKADCVPMLFPALTWDRTLKNNIKLYKPDYIFTPFYLELREGYGLMLDDNLLKIYKLSDNSKSDLHPNLQLLLSTSGSIGSPKCVRISKENLSANTYDICEYLGINENSRAITSLPMSYTYGLSIINSHLLKHGSIVLTNTSITSKKFWNLIDLYNVTDFGGVPFQYEAILKLNIDIAKHKTLEHITQAGGRLGKLYVDKIFEKCMGRIKFYIMYGQTEATARISYLPPQYTKEKSGSAGISIPHGKLYLRDECDNVIKENGVIGEIIYEGKNVSMGYARCRSDLIKGDINKGVLKTGDLGFFDIDGFLYITGRKNRIVKICGQRIDLQHLESILCDKGFQCICVGNDDLIKIFTLEEYADCIYDALKDEIRINRNYFKIELVDDFYRNANGKIDYSKYKMK
ncbi:AMP-binding protein [Ihubacter sp. rT4E-8]|uniref:AMP-binding protein n=1 Tax=Ihubacter sp. rT4E-8 TaxID=3242369 RepID=UPI003CF41498